MDIVNASYRKFKKLKLLPKFLIFTKAYDQYMMLKHVFTYTKYVDEMLVGLPLATVVYVAPPGLQDRRGWRLDTYP